MTSPPPGRRSMHLDKFTIIATGAFGVLTSTLAVINDLGWAAAAEIGLLCVLLALFVLSVQTLRRGPLRLGFIAVGVIVIGGGTVSVLGSGRVAAGSKNEEPINVTVADYPSDICSAGNGYVYRKPIAEVPAPLLAGQTESPDTFAVAAGGLPASPYKILLRVVNRGRPDAVIRNIRVVIIKKIPLSPGVHGFYSGGCGGGPIIPVQVRFNLDSGRVNDQLSPLDAAGRPIFPRKVPQGDPDAYDVGLSAESADYLFDVALDWQSNSGSGTDVFNNAGHHYYIASTKRTTHYDGGSGEWVATQTALPLWFTSND